jgi:signal transduction histidine kinase
LGIGFVPVHYFVVNQMLLMLGNLEETVRDFEFRILDYFAGQLTAMLDQDRDFEAMMHQTELDYTEKMLVMQDLSANIAHEMRTPLSGVRATMDGLETILPKLLEVYRQSIDKSSGKLSVIPEDRLRILENTPERITLMIDQANSVIDMLLMNLKDNKVDKKQFGIFSAATCIKQALDRYPFKRGELQKITLDIEQDFYFRGIDHLFIFVLFNLIKNSIYSINAALKGEILITLQPGRGLNRVVLRDTGEGIEQKNLDKIFEGFYTTREEGTGVGLAFCRRTMRSFGGGITCNSEPGEYAEFILEFPAT